MGTSQGEIEARSLSTINSIAANPPQYPHFPDVRESLTLYISRVPGTRDVILSTFRPQKKNVTAEDVANSLYYIHLDLPADELLVAPQRLEVEGTVSPRSSSESSRPKAIQRKPLPPSARIPNAPGVDRPIATASIAPPPHYVLGSRPSTAETSTGKPNEFHPPAPTADGYRPNPVFHSRQSSLASVDGPPLPPRPLANFAPAPAPGQMPTRKMMGPRPQSLLASDAQDIPGLPSSMLHERPVTPTYPTSQSIQLSSPPNTSPSKYTTARSPSPTKLGRRPSFQPFSLTIIRRDPTSGNQWNVGKVSSFQTNIPTPDMADPALSPENMGSMEYAQKIDIHLETSGYAKYRGMPTLANVEASHAALAEHLSGRRPMPGPNVMPSAGLGSKAAQRDQEEGFHRQIMMSYTKSWTSNIKGAFRRQDEHRSRSLDDSTSHEILPPPRKPFHSRHGSASTTGSTDSTSAYAQMESQQESLITKPGPGLKPRGYVFLSPWEGQCVFRTSSNGRSLKCSHTLTGTNPKFDPVTMAQNIRRDAQLSASTGGERPGLDSLANAFRGAKNVSELRFNLPNSDIFNKRREGEAGGKHHHVSLHAGFSKLLKMDPRERHSDEDDWDDDDDQDDNAPMDLSLGREKAGGGNRGKRAKLGKLIIHDEGLKMLDLVVAANMGVWWTTWEKKF